MYTLRCMRLSHLLLLALVAMASCSGRREPAGQEAAQQQQAARQEAARRATAHLEWAQKECDARLDKSLKLLRPFFARAKEGAGTFGEYAFGWGSKLRLIKDCVPFTARDSNKRFLEDKFREHVFSAEDLEKAVRGVVAQFLREAADVESQMLVRIRLDIADLPRNNLPELKTQDLFNARFEKEILDLQRKVGGQIGVDVAGIVATEIATQIAMKVLQTAITELGVEGGVLAAGAASSWTTLGVGLVTAIIADQILNWWLDPVGELNRKLASDLDRLNALIVEGSEEAPGLRAKLQEYGRARSKLRYAAVSRMLERTD